MRVERFSFDAAKLLLFAEMTKSFNGNLIFHNTHEISTISQMAHGNLHIRAYEMPLISMQK